jgi:hypothetical protein
VCEERADLAELRREEEQGSEEALGGDPADASPFGVVERGVRAVLGCAVDSFDRVAQPVEVVVPLGGAVVKLLVKRPRFCAALMRVAALG